MNDLTAPQSEESPRPSLGARLWFVWIVGMWVAFFVTLFAHQLDPLWSGIRQLSLLVQILLWLGFLPWMLGAAVWTSSWAGWLRVLLVIGLAVGWTLASIPRAPKDLG